MKKILSILLAVAMVSALGVLALAVSPGTKQEFPMLGSGGLGNSQDGLAIETTTSTSWSGTKDYNGTNFSVSQVKWTSGSALVKSVSIDSDGNLVIALKEDYTLTKVKSLVGTFRITEKGKSAYNNYAVGGVGYEFEVSYTPIDLDLYDSSIDLGLPLDDSVYLVNKDAVSYATVSFADVRGNDINVRMYDGEKLYLASNANPDLNVVKKYDNLDPNLDFITFPARPTFSSTATYYIYAEKDEYVYAISNGAVTTSGAKWDNDEGCWVLKTRTLGSYVISDKRLPTTSTSTGGTSGGNTTGGTYVPDTGANDVVGIAAALAAVALISAAAVSLKK